jgi:microcystin-dependent protein
LPQWGQVGSDGIAESAITTGKIADGAIMNVDVNASANIAYSKLSLSNSIVLGDLAAALVTYLVPVGTISAYAGDTAPNGWLMCDGTSTSGYTALAALVGATTPNLRGKFPMGKTGSGTGSTLLGSGGSNTIGETQLPSHAHSAGTLAADAVGTHGHSGGTNYGGEHNHTYNQTTVSQRTVFNAADQTDDVVLAFVSSNTSTAADHFHIIGQDGAHGHTISGATATKGSGVDYYQPFVSVNYIIKY